MFAIVIEWILITGLSGYVRGEIHLCGVGRQHRRHFIESRFGNRHSKKSDDLCPLEGFLQYFA